MSHKNAGMVDLGEPMGAGPSVPTAASKPRKYYPGIDLEVSAHPSLKEAHVGDKCHFMAEAVITSINERTDNSTGKQLRNMHIEMRHGKVEKSRAGSDKYCPQCAANGSGMYCRECGAKLKKQMEAVAGSYSGVA